MGVFFARNERRGRMIGALDTIDEKNLLQKEKM
jgi:hypothetical protein